MQVIHSTFIRPDIRTNLNEGRCCFFPELRIDSPDATSDLEPDFRARHRDRDFGSSGFRFDQRQKFRMQQEPEKSDRTQVSDTAWSYF